MSTFGYALRVIDVYRVLFTSPSALFFLTFLLVLWQRPKGLTLPLLPLIAFYWTLCLANGTLALLLTSKAICEGGFHLHQLYFCFWVLKIVEMSDTFIKKVLDPECEVTFVQLHFHFALLSLGDLATRIFVHSTAFILPMTIHCISELLSHASTLLHLATSKPRPELDLRVAEFQSLLFFSLLIYYVLYEFSCIFVVLYVLMMVHRHLTKYVLDFLLDEKHYKID